MDETGQDTLGRLFIVSILGCTDREEVSRICLEAEKESNKGKTKWGRSRYEYRLKYIRTMLKTSPSVMLFFYAAYKNT